MNKKLTTLSKLIGNTPLIEIKYKYKGNIKNIYAKLEWYNLTGSIKDRVVFEILSQSYKNKELKPSDNICEVTSGNTGISLAVIGAYLGHNTTIIMPDWLSNERYKLLSNYGSEIVTVSRDEGGFKKCFEIAKQKNNVFLLNQFENKYNVIAQQKTGNEIIDKAKKNNIQIKSFVSGVGTGGTLMGVAKALKQKNYNTNIIAIQPASSPTLKNKFKSGEHKIQGISDEFVPEIFDDSMVDDILDITDNDAIAMSQKLAEQLGLGVGISSGANFVGCVLANELCDDNSFTVFVDDNKKYVSTDLTKKINTKLCDKIKLISYKVIE